MIALLRKGSALLVFACLPVAVLWKGGKSLESTWFLVFVAWIAALALWNMRNDEEKDIPGGMWWAAVLLFLWTVLSYVQSQTGNNGLDEVFRTGALTIIFFWSARMAREQGFTSRFAQVLAWTTLAAVAIGIAVYALQPVTRFVGTFFDARFDTDYWPNAWAEFVLLAWPVVLLHAKKSGKRIWLVVLGMVLGSLFLSYSRGAYIAFGGQLVLLGIATALRKPKNIRSIVLLVFFVGLVSLLTFFSANLLRSDFHEVQNLEQKVTFTSDEGASSVDERRAFMEQALKLAMEEPITGYGPYSFRFVQTRLENGIYATSDHPHNLFLKTAMEEGIPAAGLLILLLLFILVPACTRIVKKESDDAAPLLLIGVAGVLAHVLIDYNLQFVGNALPFWMMLGCLTPIVAPVVRPLLPTRRSTEIVIATLLLVVAMFEGRYLIISSYGRHAEANGKYDIALAYYDSARSELFSRDLHLSRAFLDMKLGKTAEAKQALTQYLWRNNIDARAWLALGRVLQTSAEWRLSLAAYRQAYDLGKWNLPGALQGVVDMETTLGERGAIDGKRAEYDMLLAAYHGAIMKNVHFIALGTVPEEFVTLTDTFAKLYPKEKKEYETMGMEALTHAKEERTRFSARPAGRLW